MSRSGNDGGFVGGGFDPQGDFAGEVLARFDAVLGAGVEKYPKGNLSLAPQAIDIAGDLSGIPRHHTLNGNAARN